MTDQRVDHAASALVVSAATVIYRGGVRALSDVSFSVPQGSIAALVGVNGAGKSTLFKAIMGFVRLAQGRIDVLGVAAAQALRRGWVAYVPQVDEVDWTFPLLVEDVVMMGRYGHMGWWRMPRARDRDAVAEALARTGLESLRKRQIGELSGGQRRRLFVARALAQDSRVILLDEPLTGVDLASEERIMAVLRELRSEGRMMLVSTHNLGSVPNYCDRTILIRGTVLAAGPTDEVYTQRNLELAFSGVLRHTVLDRGGDDRPSTLGIFTDDEQALVLRDGRTDPGADVQQAAEGGVADRSSALPPAAGC